MTEQTVYCEECLEEIPYNEVFWDEERLYCQRCGSEVESPDQDLFEQIEDNQDVFLFRDDEDAALEEEEEEGNSDTRNGDQAQGEAETELDSGGDPPASGAADANEER